MDPWRRTISDTDRFWEEVLCLAEEHRLVPVVGHELVTMPDGEPGETLERRLGRRLGTAWGTAGQDLDSVLADRLTERDAGLVVRELRAELDALEPVAVPDALSKLAQMEAFELFVTTTFDTLTERAVDEARFDGQRQTLVFSYAPMDRQDLPRELDRLGRPAVFHLLGRVSGTPGSFAMTRRERDDFLVSLEAHTEDTPSYLLDRLRRQSMLLLGTRVADWLTRWFVSGTHSGKRTIVDVGPFTGEGEVSVLTHGGGGARVYRTRGASGFVDELYRRWTVLDRDDSDVVPAGLHALPTLGSGAVLLSHVSEDEAAAMRLAAALDRAGVDVLRDCDDQPLPGRVARKLRSYLSECALFVPMTSSAAAGSRRRFHDAPWADAIGAAAREFPGLVAPVRLDERASTEETLPEAFGPAEWTTLPEGRPDDAFLDRVVRTQRRFRAASFA